MGTPASILPRSPPRLAIDRLRSVAITDLVWLLAVPCTGLVLAAILLLGPPLGSLLTPTHVPRFWTYTYFSPRPEPLEHARFLLALLGPLLLSGSLALLGPRIVATGWPWPAAAGAKLLALATQVGFAVFLVVCVVAQRSHTRAEVITGGARRAFFTPTTLLVGAVLAVVCAVALAARPLTDAAARVLRDTRSRQLVWGGVALVLTAAWLLTTLQLDRSAGGTNQAVQANMPFWLDETFAVLSGRTPFVNFASQYSQLWPFVTAAAMSLFGASIAAYTTTLALGTAAALAAVFATFRRVTRSSLAALALYLPFLATGFFMEVGPLANRYGPSNLLSLFPMRYAGPYLLAWVVARHLDRAHPRRASIVFACAGVVVLNNLEFGVPAFGATIAALAWTRGPWSWAVVRRLGAAVVVGVGGALALLTLLTLVRAGSLPHLGMLTFYSKLYGVLGFGMLPMPTLGFHLVVYATFGGALVVATIRRITRQDDVLLTGMLAWAGVFGLGVGSYFAGRSHPEVLIDLFSAWTFALALLAVAAVRAILARPSRVARIPELAVLVGMGIAACSLAQTPTPWSQVHRLGHRSKAPWYEDRHYERFVARVTRPGEPVVVEKVPGHRIAYDAGVVNVNPYAGWDSMPLESQYRDMLDALLRAHGHKLFMSSARLSPDFLAILKPYGFRQGITSDGVVEMITDRRDPP